MASLGEGARHSSSWDPRERPGVIAAASGLFSLFATNHKNRLGYVEIYLPVHRCSGRRLRDKGIHTSSLRGLGIMRRNALGPLFIFHLMNCAPWQHTTERVAAPCEFCQFCLSPVNSH